MVYYADALLKVCGCTGLVMPARSAASRQALQTTLVVIGWLAVCQRLPGNSQTLGVPPQAAPVCAEFLQQFGAEHDVAVFASFAALNVDHHSLAVDVADFQVGQLGAAESGGISGHQQHAVKRRFRGVDQLRDFFLAEDQSAGAQSSLGTECRLRSRACAAS